VAQATSDDAPDQKVAAARAMESLTRFREDLEWGRTLAVRSILEVGLEYGGRDEEQFHYNVNQLLKAERDWAKRAILRDAELNEAERLLVGSVGEGE
jgi:hypothetical protein